MILTILLIILIIAVIGSLPVSLQQGMGIFSRRNFEDHCADRSHIVFDRSSFLRNELDLQQNNRRKLL